MVQKAGKHCIKQQCVFECVQFVQLAKLVKSHVPVMNGDFLSHFTNFIILFEPIGILMRHDGTLLSAVAPLYDLV